MKKLIFIIALAALLVGCTPEMPPEEMDERAKVSMKMIEDTPYEDMIHDWLMYRIRTITGEKITVGESDKPVLLETFAVWCPTCRKQQDQFKKLDQDEVVIISIDTDPNEDVALVKEHVAEYGFDWHFAVSDIEMTLSLIDSFGPSVVNAPSAPVILVCPNGDGQLLPWGVKTKDELEEAIAGC